MKKLLLILFLGMVLPGPGLPPAKAQCSICARNTQQLGERPAKALNAGIIYLALAPLAIFGIIGYRWWKSNAPETK
ncbi:MAG: hypothetical protein ACHQEM_10570 [Chitinophagales bacterium]